MLSQSQIDAMVQGQKEGGTVIDMPPPQKSKDEALQEALDKADSEVALRLRDLPFTPAALAAFAQEQFERRVPVIIEKTKNQIRQLVAFGERHPEMRTAGLEDYAPLVVKALRDEGFAVREVETGFVIDLVADDTKPGVTVIDLA